MTGYFTHVVGRNSLSLILTSSPRSGRSDHTKVYGILYLCLIRYTKTKSQVARFGRTPGPGGYPNLVLFD